MRELAVTRRVAVAAVAVAAVVLAGCDGGSGGPTRAASAAEPATVRTATCDIWNAASPAEQLRLVRGMREFFGGQVDSPGMRGQVLPDGRARRLFDAYCDQPFAGAFSLYRIYGNAAAFTNAKR